jgi:hypothetical protein
MLGVYLYRDKVLYTKVLRVLVHQMRYYCVAPGFSIDDLEPQWNTEEVAKVSAWRGYFRPLSISREVREGPSFCHLSQFTHLGQPEVPAHMR